MGSWHNCFVVEAEDSNTALVGPFKAGFEEEVESEVEFGAALGSNASDDGGGRDL